MEILRMAASLRVLLLRSIAARWYASVILEQDPLHGFGVRAQEQSVIGPNKLTARRGHT
jgi:hypothetical protein